jgi:hypothetical protein
MEQKYEIVRLLRDLSTGKRRLYKTGLCHELQHNIDYDSLIGIWMWECTKRWPGAADTASDGYVVKHPTLTPWKSYHRFSSNGWLMNGRSPYGMERRKLAKYLADELEKTDEV